jgi:hypothetical protein
MATLSNKVNSLTWNVPIVNPNGTPTHEFMIKWQQQASANASVPDLTTAKAVSAVIDLLGSTVNSLLIRGPNMWGISTLSAVLDTLGNARGDIIFRGASGWTVLAPGTNGQVLTTGGVGADLSWSSASGGGASASSFFLDGTHGYIAEVDSNGILVLDSAGRGVYDTDPVLPAAMVPTDNVTIGVTGAVIGLIQPPSSWFVESQILRGSEISLTSGVAADITHISLSAGEWLIWGNVFVDTTGSMTNLTRWISTVSATEPTPPNRGGKSSEGLPFTSASTAGALVGLTRVLLTSTTTYYLGVLVGLASGSAAAFGYIGARRLS